MIAVAQINVCLGVSPSHLHRLLGLAPVQSQVQSSRLFSRSLLLWLSTCGTADDGSASFPQLKWSTKRLKCLREPKTSCDDQTRTRARPC